MSITFKDRTEIEGQVDLQPGSPQPVEHADGTARIARLARGARPLSDKEVQQRQSALACSIVDPVEAGTGCVQVLHFGLFFDGTGNNRVEEMAKPAEKRALSNIARLFFAHVDDRTQVLRSYLSGVGTPCPEVNDDGGMLGLAIGKGGGERVAHALKQLDELINRQPGPMKIMVVNVSVFGFSRGAAQARAFVRDLAARCTRQPDGTWLYGRVPLRIAFLGVFDTVCSVWSNLAAALVNAKDGHGQWAHDVSLPAIVEQSVHMTAAHELRPQFPLDSTREGAHYPSNTVEIWYPGVHSDVGGGYDPKHQGRKNSIARFALNEMYDMAKVAGVLLQPVTDLPGHVRNDFDKDDPELRAAYNGYLQAVRRKQGRMEDVQAAHMELLHRWLKVRVAQGESLGSMQRLAQREAALKAELKTLYRSRAGLRDPYNDYGAPPTEAELREWNRVEHSISERREELSEVNKQRKGLARENDALSRRMARLRRTRERGGRLTMAEQTMVQAWDDPAPLPRPVHEFFDGYGHDSVSHWFTGDLTQWRTLYFGDYKYSPGQESEAGSLATEHEEPAFVPA